MGKKELTRIVLAITLSTTVMAIAVGSNKPTSDVVINIERVRVDYLEDILQRERESNERIRIAEEEAMKVEQARIAEEVRIAEELRVVELQRQEELKKQEAKAVAKATTTPSRGSNGVKQVTFELTFYTSLPEENGGYSSMANGKSVETATNAIASNYYKLGTQINLTGYGNYVVQDRGGSSFNSSTRLDVLVLRKSGESNSQYKTRVRNMGRVKVVGYVFN